MCPDCPLEVDVDLSSSLGVDESLGLDLRLDRDLQREALAIHERLQDLDGRVHRVV